MLLAKSSKELKQGYRILALLSLLPAKHSLDARIEEPRFAGTEEELSASVSLSFSFTSEEPSASVSRSFPSTSEEPTANVSLSSPSTSEGQVSY